MKDLCLALLLSLGILNDVTPFALTGTASRMGKFGATSMPLNSINKPQVMYATQNNRQDETKLNNTKDDKKDLQYSIGQADNDSLNKTQLSANQIGISAVLLSDTEKIATRDLEVALEDSSVLNESSNEMESTVELAETTLGDAVKDVTDKAESVFENSGEKFESAALEWASKQARELGLDNFNKAALDRASEATTEYSISGKRKKFVVVGGGWGGWGAAKALCQSNVDAEVILIDALPDPTGKTPYLSKTGKPVEAGTRGFWMDYPNINELCKELNLDENDVFTPFTNSSFYSPDGLEATAPVFSQATFPNLPSPLGQVLATFPLFERIPLVDRASMVGLLVATLDCLGSQDEKVYEQYDRMSAHDLFVKFGLSERLVADFIKPTLLVGLFKPPEELSALVVMELLYYYALAHQDSFDVRWIKNGTVSDSLIAPLADKLVNEHNLTVLGGCKVGEISLCKDAATNLLSAHSIKYQHFNSNEHCEIYNVDGVILALGCRGMESVVKASPELARLPVFSKAASLKGIDVISCRIWLDRMVPTRTPANVFSRFDALRGAGGTFFMLDQLQENNPDLWGGEKPQGSVVACDFYNAGALMSLSEQDIIDILMNELLPSAVPRFADARVVDSWVGKYSGTVSWFSPGSYTLRPPLEGAGKNVLPNVKCAGDWVRMGEREHGAKGLCQERAFVSGIEAANSLLSSTTTTTTVAPTMAKVLPVREDEIQFKVGSEINRRVMKFFPRFWVR